MSDPAARLAYLAATAGEFWPHPDPPMVVLPGRRRPRLLVPVRPRRAAAAAAIRYTAQQGLSGRLGGAALAGAALAGLCARLPVAVGGTGADRESVDDHLGAVLGMPVVTALALTAPRANRKPVLQVFDRRGRTVAFVKVGVDRLTRSLVDHEATALRHLAAADLDGLRIPAVLYHGRWRGHSLLAMSVLPVGSRLAPASPLLHRAMRAIAGSGGDIGPADDGYLARTRARAAAAAERSGGAAAGMAEWLDLFDAVASAGPAGDLAVAAWHGDWTEWNCGRRRGTVRAWDWERYATGVPRGFDALHFAFNRSAATRGVPLARAAGQLVERAPDHLARWGLGIPAARATALLYLLEIGLRYRLDDPDGRGAPARLADWAYPAIRSGLARPSGIAGGRR